MFSPSSIYSFGIFVNTALATFHFAQEIHPGHGGPPPVQPFEPALSEQNIDSSPPSTAPQQASSPQRPFDGLSPHQGAAAVIYAAGSPGPSSPEYDENESYSSLSSLCRDSDPSLSTIILGFIDSFSPSNGFPVADFSAAGCTRVRSPHDPWAPGLAKCLELGDEVRRCQEMGRKLVLRIGGGSAGGGRSIDGNGVVEGPIDGATTTTSPTEDMEQLGSPLRFRNAPNARRAAIMLWKLFGQGDTHGPTGADSMRPLGDGVIVDGFDLAPPHTTDTYFTTFASTLHDLAHRGTNRKRCHLSTTPACLPPSLSSSSEQDQLDEFRETVDVVYVPVTTDGEAKGEVTCHSRYRRVVEKDEQEEVWRAASEGRAKADDEKDKEGKEELREDGRDELKF